MITQLFIDNKIKMIQYALGEQGLVLSNKYLYGVLPNYEDKVEFNILSLYVDILYKYNCPKYLFTITTNSYGTSEAQLVLEFKNSTADVTVTYGNGTTTSWDNIMKEFEDSFIFNSDLEGLYGEADEIEDGIYRFCVYDKADNDFTDIYIDSITNGIANGDRLPDEYSRTNVRAWKYSNTLTEAEIIKIVEHIDKLVNYRVSEI